MNRRLLVLLLLVAFAQCKRSANDKNVKSHSKIDISSFEEDHPLWDTLYERDYNVNDLNQMLDVSAAYQDSLEIVFVSFSDHVQMHECLSVEQRETLISTFRELLDAHEGYVNKVRQIEILSHRNGKSAGRLSLDYEIYLKRKFYSYVKHLANTIYFSHLEPGVAPCD